MIQILDNVVFSNDDIDFDYIDCDIVAFFSDGMVLNTIDLNNTNFNNNDLKTTIYVKFVVWSNDYKQR